MGERTPAQRAASARWERKAYDAITIRFPKGTLEHLKQLASAEGVSLNRYIAEAVEARSGLRLTLDGEFKTASNSETKN